MPRARPANAPEATFLAQLLSGPSDRTLGRALPATREGSANTAYRRTDTSDVKRMPMGYRKSISA